MRVGADGFEVVLVGEVGVGAAGEAGAEDVAHGDDYILMPEIAVAAAGAEVADAERGHAAEALHFFPEARFGAGVEDVEVELAEVLHCGACLEFVDDGEGVDFPESCIGPEAFEAEGDLAVLHGKLVVGEAEVLVEPFEEFGLEDAALAVEGVAGEPDQLRLMEAEPAGVFELLAEFVEDDDVAEADCGGAVLECKAGARAGEMLPDELEHEDLVEVGIEERPGDWVELPVMVVRTAGDVNDHDATNLWHWSRIGRECFVTMRVFSALQASLKSLRG